MMSSIEAALFIDGLWLLVGAVFLAGLARGFVGFGTAMIFMPFAATVLEPLVAVLTLLIFDLIGPLPILPRAVKDGELRDVFWLAGGALIGAPFGLLVLMQISPDPFRWLVAAASLALLILLMTGWRYRGRLSRAMIIVTGAIGGLLGGIAGMAGTPVISLYMASTKSAAVIRANIFLFLLLTDITVFVIVLLAGRFTLTPIILGLVLSLPYMLGNVLGQRLFDPAHERIFRQTAYALIAMAAIVNLPIWGL